MTEHSYRNRVYIHGGKYKGRYGTYMGECGKVMCSIKIDGDKVQQRNLWLTSITIIAEDKDDAEGKDDVSSRSESIMITKQEMLKILKLDSNYMPQEEEHNTDNEKMVQITMGDLKKILKTVSEMNHNINSIERQLQSLVNSRKEHSNRT
jgi:hypothetical protein